METSDTALPAKPNTDTRHAPVFHHLTIDDGMSIRTLTPQAPGMRKPFRAAEIYDYLEKHPGVEYIHEASPEAEEESEALTPARLDALPPTLRNDLADALESLEIERIEAAVQRISTHDPALQKKLSRIARHFDYLAILRALRKA